MTSLTVVSSAQTVLLEEDFTNGIPNSWSVFNIDQYTPNSDVSFVNDGWVGFTSVTDTCAISTSYYDVNDNEVSLSQDYLVTPRLDLLAFGHLLSWESKSFDANYPETYYVLLSSTDSLPSSFKDTLKIVSNDSPNWKSFTVNLFSNGYANQSVYVAFRNASIDAYLLGVDNIKVTTNDPANILDSQLSTLIMFPNPVTNSLFIESGNGLNYNITNLAGQMVKSGILREKNVSFQDLSSGIYFISLFNNESQITKKIIKK